MTTVTQNRSTDFPEADFSFNDFLCLWNRNRSERGSGWLIRLSRCSDRRREECVLHAERQAH